MALGWQIRTRFLGERGWLGRIYDCCIWYSFFFMMEDSSFLISCVNAKWISLQELVSHMQARIVMCTLWILCVLLLFARRVVKLNLFNCPGSATVTRIFEELL